MGTDSGTSSPFWQEQPESVKGGGGGENIYIYVCIYTHIFSKNAAARAVRSAGPQAGGAAASLPPGVAAAPGAGPRSAKMAAARWLGAAAGLGGR